MGTHPIFESDFDCLTDLMRIRKTVLFVFLQVLQCWASSYDTHAICGKFCVTCSPHLLGKRSADESNELSRTERSHNHWRTLDSLLNKRSPEKTRERNGVEKRSDKKNWFVTVRRDDWNHLCYT